ncbi:MAG: porin [Phycisphaerae bacterium]
MLSSHVWNRETNRALAIVFTGAACAIALCQTPQDVAPRDARLERLEAAAARQSERIAQLETQLAAQANPVLDAARLDVMREQISAILADQEFRQKLLPATLLAGYEHGFYLQSADERFRMVASGMMQFRWSHAAINRENRYTRPGVRRDDRDGFDIARLRLKLAGYAHSKDLSYQIEARAESSEEYDATVESAYVNYRLMDELQFRMGMFPFVSTRGVVLSSSNQQFADRTLLDAVFGLGRGIGFRAWGQLAHKRVEYYVDVANALRDGRSLAGGRTITPDPPELDNNPAILARLVWHALGDNPTRDFAHASDITFHETPALDLAMHYAFNDDAGDRRTVRLPFARSDRSGGGFALTTTNGTQMHQFGFDSAFKLRGFSVTGEYVLRLIDPRRAAHGPFTPLWQLSGEGSTTAQHGGQLQVGYFLPIAGFEKKIELIGRVGGISVNAGGTEGVWEYAGGVNYFIVDDRVRLTGDVTKIYELPISGAKFGYPNVNDDLLLFRLQLQVAF